MNNHAIVIGSSMTGLLTARVLSEHFDKVTIIERDELPQGPDFRKGVPQGRHFHILLAKGLQILRELFPGFEEDLKNAGASPFEGGTQGRWLMSEGWLPVINIGVELYTCSRIALEWLVRQRLYKLQNVSFIEHCEVTELLSDPTKTTITGVRMQSRKPGADQATELIADLVVDASGRGSHLPEWLGALGYPAPQETLINSFLGYATRVFKKPEGFKAEWVGVFLFPKPPHLPRGGAMFTVEGDRWILTCAGAAKDYPPTDEAAFTEYVRSLRDPIIYNLIKDAEPLSPIYGYQNTANRLRHYEKMPRFPEHLIALGDSVCAFNPLYGQGMTTAALGAMRLKRELENTSGNLSGFSKRFQKALAKTNADPWLLATSTDLIYPTTEGGQANAIINFQQWYINKLFPLLNEDHGLIRDFVDVFHLVQSPLILFKPKRIFQMLRHALMSQRAGDAAELRPDFGFNENTA